MKSQSDSKLTNDLTLLYSKLVELGMEHGNGRIYLADLEIDETDARYPP